MAKIKDIPKFERPREKLLEKGANALTNSELLAIVLGSGIKGTNVVVLAKKIVRKFGDKLLNASVDDLQQISGIGQAKALQIFSALELAKRIYGKQNSRENIILSPKDALAQVPDLKNKKQEHLICLYLNARNALLKNETVSIGTLDRSIIHPREVFAPGIETHAAGVILIHNHPSGNSALSEQDKLVAKRIIEAGKLMGINVIDFLIVAENDVKSILGEIRNTELNILEYIADGSQISLFDLLIDSDKGYFSANIANEKEFSSRKTSDQLKFIDLFAGIGGIRMAFENKSFKCVFSNDFDKYCKITYDLNFSDPSKPDSGMFLEDIDKLKTDFLPEFDVLTGGFPCQPFSIAGYKKGFKDEGRGNLFFKIVDILKAKKPRAFLLENVKNLKTHGDGETLKIIRGELEKIGYNVLSEVLNTMEYGDLPQNRERIYIVGFLDKDAFYKFSFPGKVQLTKTINDCLEKDADEKYYYNGKNLYSKLAVDVNKRNVVYQWRRKYVRQNKNGVCPTLTANMGTGGHNVPIILDDKGIRKLTPRECANFQGFPKNFKMPNIADSHLYKQFGNSVSIPVVERIAENMKRTLI